MPYQTLGKLFYSDASNERFTRNKELAEARLNAESTFRTGFMTDAGELFLAMPRDLSLAYEHVMEKERSVALLQARLPPIAHGALVRSLVVEEVVSTNGLEGVHSTRRQISDLLDMTPSSAQDIERKRFRELAHLYLELSDANHIIPRTPEDIRKVYDRIMEGEDLGDDAPDGRLFRRGGVEIIGSGGKVLHEGLEPEPAIIDAMTHMLEIANSDAVPSLYGAILSHYLFEYAHPFYDGNGRTGRYLLALFLTKPLSVLSALSLSRSIAESKTAYYRAFRDSETKLNHGELTAFVISILDYLSKSQDRIIEGLTLGRTRLDAVNRALDDVDAISELPRREKDVLNVLAQYRLFGAFPDVSADVMGDCLGVGEQMARKHLRRLEDKSLVTVASKRPLRFVLSPAAEAELGIAP